MFALQGDILVKEQMQSQIRGQTRPGINGRILKRVAVPIPPLIEQNEIIRRVKALFNLTEIIEKRVVIAAARTEKVTQAILSKAFRGELVPTEAELARREGRSFEPASKLLARIKSDARTELSGKLPRTKSGLRSG
jgi:type I restriction enzyme S subunit